MKAVLDSRIASFLPENIFDAVPTANRFLFDPLERRGFKVKLPRPSLFVWWLGNSERIEWTTVKTYRKRKLHLLYMFPELPSRDILIERAGLSNAIDATLHRMSQRQQDDNFTPPDGSPGMTISQSLGDRSTMAWKFLGGRPGRIGIGEGPGAERRAAQRSGRDFPAYKGEFEILELVEGWKPVDPDDLLTDAEFAIKASAGDENSDGTDVEIMTRILEGHHGI